MESTDRAREIERVVRVSLPVVDMVGDCRGELLVLRVVTKFVKDRGMREGAE